MASCPTKGIFGYEDSRFEKDIDEDFHCSICFCVLKDPRTCRNNEHAFCLDCISEHLRVNSETCPKCKEDLTVATLRRPRLLNNCLSKLKINCDHASRGCLEYIWVKDLESHADSCGFAPVLCSNVHCGMVINKQEKKHHETVVCEYRKEECLDSGIPQEAEDRLEGRLMELNGKGEANLMEKMKGSLDGMNKINEKVETLQRMNEMVNSKVEALTKMQNQVHQEIGGVKKEVRELVREEVGNVHRDVKDVKVMMSQILEKLNVLELMNKLQTPSEGMLNTRKEDILIAGHSYGEKSKSTEIFSWKKNSWFEISPMNEKHTVPSSFVYEDQLFVVGGYNSKTIEILNLNELPLKWKKCATDLPFPCCYHQTVVHEQRVIYIGGYNNNIGRMSDVISELQLTSRSIIMKELCRIPESRYCHGAEIVDDKVLIYGGLTDGGNALDSVLEFDPKSNECKRMPPLPYPLSQMATVHWRDQVVLLGGLNKDGKALNDVFMYNCKTGKITVLPSMMGKRFACCAVISGNTVVVMGGVNEKGEDLNSVECFTMGGSTWKHLSAMNMARIYAVADVLPSTRKYV